MIKKIIENTKEQALKDYFTLLRFPSVGSEKKHEKDTLQCADWLQEYIEKIGFSVQRWETSTFPVLFAESKKIEGKPTLLLYGHYDVQPADPLDKWISPPFEPTIREGQVYARGAQDNKGQLFYVLWALQILMKKDGKLPINIKLCIEGDEEMGSKGLSEILPEKKHQLASDWLAVIDVGIPDRNTPAVTLGVRGLLALQVDIEGAKTDLHSGSHGGIVYNPIHALVQMLASLRDSEGKIAVPGFYDKVQMIEGKSLLSLHFDPVSYQEITGAKTTGGEKGFSPLERAWLRPTLEINGIWGGYTGDGFKTVIPARAHAKISCRLVPEQEPEEIASLLEKHLNQVLAPGMNMKITRHGGIGRAAHANPESKIVKAFSQSYQDAFGKECQKILEGASIPIVCELAKTARDGFILVGLGLMSDQIHAPNEHFGLDRIELGAEIIVRAIEYLDK